VRRGKGINGDKGRLLKTAAGDTMLVGFGLLNDIDDSLLNVPREAGARVAITVFMDTGRIIFQTRSQKVEATFRHTGVIHPAIDSDNDNEFSIEIGVRL
jgi:hypothetical protein